ncbi:sugar phosphate isomerase/epimerase [bacterium]|nr:sugar phosphate isomerase/epimerase [bacterium]
MKPSIWTDAFVELQPEEAVKRMAKVGWKYIELADKHWRDIDKRQNPEQDFAKLKKQCEVLRIEILQMHGPMFNPCEEEEQLQGHIATAKRALKWASILEVQWVVFHPGCVPMAEDEQVAEQVRQKNLLLFHELVADAQRLNIRIAVENIFDNEKQGRRTFGAIPPDLLWLVQNTAPGMLGVCWDTGHGNIQKLDQYRAITTLGKHLVATHIADNDTSKDQHLLPFEGNIDWKAVISGLRDIRYDGLFNLEIGGAVHKVPIGIRESKLRYALELITFMIESESF